MKIGILAYRQYPYISANTDIAYKIGESIKKYYKHDVVHIGWRQDKEQKEINEYNGMKIEFLNVKCCNKMSRIQNIINSILGEEIFHLPYAYSLKRIVNREKIKALICVIAPNTNASIAFTKKLNIPIILYQLDPYYNLMDQVNLKLKRKFKRIISKAEHVFTTELLYSEYRKDDDFLEYLNKISVVQFPKLEHKVYKNNDKEKTDTISLLYAGSLSSDVRSPQILIDLKRCLPNEYKIIFCGSCDNKVEQKKLEKAGIICRGYCSQKQLTEEVENATAFINIGNLVKNQMGSKIIDYIATGKPILNIVQLETCPTIKVLKNYELKFNIHINELKSKSKLNELRGFLESNANKQIKYEQIESMYFEFTPKFVAGELLSKIVF